MERIGKKITLFFLMSFLVHGTKSPNYPRTSLQPGVKEAPPLKTSSSHSAPSDDLRRYRVDAIQGEILALFSWSTSWEIIKKGTILEENVLLQNLAPAVAELNLLNPDSKNEDEATIRLDLFQPTMLRVTKPIGRTLVIRSGMMSAEQLKFPFNEKAMSELSAVKPLASAWYRTQNMTSLMTPNMKTFRKMIQAKQAKGLPSIKKDFGKLVIRQPMDGSIFVVEKFPLKISVQWESLGPVNPKTKKEVFLWQDEQELDDPLVVTHDSSAMIEIPRAGTYFLGVATEDRMVVSEQILMSFE